MSLHQRTVLILHSGEAGWLGGRVGGRGLPFGRVVLSPWSMRGQLSGLDGLLTRGWCLGLLAEGTAAASRWEGT